MFLTPSDTILFLLAFAAGLAGMQVERARARWAGQRWRQRRRQARSPWRPRLVTPRNSPLGDAPDQLRLVMGADFKPRRLLNRSEFRVFEAAERAVRDQRLAWRVMAQVSLGEVLSSADERAYAAINSKRVDVLLVARDGRPLAAVEYQGAGHYQGSAPARDAVKKEALRRAGVAYIEMTQAHGPKDLAREIARLAGRQIGTEETAVSAAATAGA